MKLVNLLFLCLFMTSTTFAMDEADIPPPPMPDYMKKHQDKIETEDASDLEMDREVASEPIETQTVEDIKHEFLQAGDEDEDIAEDLAVEEALEGSIDEAAAKEIFEQSSQEVYEEPVNAPIQEVREVQESEKEFEQVSMENPQAPAPAVEVVEDSEADLTSEKLAAVEQTLEAAEAEAEQRLENPRKPSSKKKFKSGMYKFDDKCVMHQEPSSMSNEAGSIRAGRKLWIDPHNDSWHKAYKKSGTVYISADCLP